jgi:hypothetical protein
LGKRPLKFWAFVADIKNEFILGLDILRAHDASVDIGSLTLRLAGEEISLWSPGDDKDKVMTAKCEGILMVRSESTLEVESSLIEQRLQVHPPAEIDIVRASNRGRREVPLRNVNPVIKHCEPVTIVTPQYNVTNAGMSKYVEKYQEVTKKETTEIPVRKLRKRRRIRNLAALRRQKEKGRSPSRCDYTKRVTVAGKTTSGSANVAWLQRGRIASREFNGDNVASTNQRGRTCKKRPRRGSTCNNGIGGRGLQQKLRSRIGIKDTRDILHMSLRIAQTSDGNEVKNSRLHNENRIAESLMEERNMKKWTLWKGGPPPKWKKLQIKNEPDL